MLSKYWIPAFAGMTPVGLKFKFHYRHSEGSRNPENKFLNRDLGGFIIIIL